MNMYEYAYVYVYSYVYSMYICIRVCILYTYLYMCMCKYMFVYMYCERDITLANAMVGWNWIFQQLITVAFTEACSTWSMREVALSIGSLLMMLVVSIAVRILRRVTLTPTIVLRMMLEILFGAMA